MTSVTMTVLGRRSEDIDEFMEKLEATGAFEDVAAASQQDRTEDGLLRVAHRGDLHCDRSRPAGTGSGATGRRRSRRAGSAGGRRQSRRAPQRGRPR